MRCAAMQQLLLVFLSILLVILKGVSATCISNVNENITVISNREIDVISNIPAVPRCIRCAYLPSNFIPVFVTDPNDVLYTDNLANPIMNGSINDVTVFNDGLLVKDAASSFNNDDTIRCNFDDGTSSGLYTITFKISIFLPPPITPAGTVLDYVEGDNVTLTCTGDGAVANDLYQWTLPDGSLIPSLNPIGADSGLPLELKNVNRTDNGVYTCTGTISGTSVSVESSVTLNIQYPAQVLSLVNISTGSMLILNCSFEGNPTPSVSWSHNGMSIVSDTITDSYAILEISTQSFGEFTCTVNNSLFNTPDSSTFILFHSQSSTSTSMSPTIPSRSEVVSGTRVTHQIPSTNSLSPSSSRVKVTTGNVDTVSAVAYIIPIVIVLLIVLGVVIIVTMYVWWKRGNTDKGQDSADESVDLANFRSQTSYIAENPTTVWDPLDDQQPSSNTTSALSPYASVKKEGDTIIINNGVGRPHETPPTSVSFQPPLHKGRHTTPQAASLPSYASVIKIGNKIVVNEETSDETPPPIPPQSLEEITIPPPQNGGTRDGRPSYIEAATPTYAEVFKKKTKKTGSDDNGRLLEDSINNDDDDDEDTPPEIIPYNEGLLKETTPSNTNTIVYAELGEIRRNTKIKPPVPQETVMYSTLANINNINPMGTPPPPLPQKRMSLRESRMQILQDQLSLSLSSQHNAV